MILAFLSAIRLSIVYYGKKAKFNILKIHKSKEIKQTFIKARNWVDKKTHTDNLHSINIQTSVNFKLKIDS